MATTVIIRDFLLEVATFVATTASTTIGASGRVFVGILPDNPQNAISIGMQPASAPSRKSEPARLLGTQILIRNNSLSTGLAESQTIFDALDGKFNVLSSVKGRAESLTSSSGAYFKDANGRFVFPLNFQWRLVYLTD